MDDILLRAGEFGPYQMIDATPTYYFSIWLIICSRFNAKLVEVNDPYIVLVQQQGERRERF